MKTFISTLLLLMICLGNSHLVYAEGIALGATRIIYPLGEKQTSINVVNTNKKETFWCNLGYPIRRVINPHSLP